MSKLFPLIVSLLIVQASISMAQPVNSRDFLWNIRGKWKCSSAEDSELLGHELSSFEFRVFPRVFKYQKIYFIGPIENRFRCSCYESSDDFKIELQEKSSKYILTYKPKGIHWCTAITSSVRTFPGRTYEHPTGAQIKRCSEFAELQNKGELLEKKSNVSVMEIKETGSLFIDHQTYDRLHSQVPETSSYPAQNPSPVSWPFPRQPEKSRSKDSEPVTPTGTVIPKPSNEGTGQKLK